LRALDNTEATPMAGTEGAYCTPVFSPDGQWLAFFDTGARELRRISIQGGPPVTLAKVGGIFGASWGNSGAIIYCDGTVRTGIHKVSSAGGTPELITHVDSTKGEIDHRWPVLLPGGKAFLFVIENGNGPDEAQIVAQRLDTGQRRLVVQGGTYPQYVPEGYLAYVQRGALMAAPFDVDRLQVRGSAVPVSEHVRESGFGAAEFGLSSQGSLVYVPAPGGVQADQRRLVWVRRDGTEQSLPTPERDYSEPRLSPDGRRVAVTIQSVQQGAQIWLVDLSRETLTRFTFEGNTNEYPDWTPDAKRIVFHSDKEGQMNLFWQRADGSGGLERLTTGRYPQAPSSWSPDGQLLAFTELTGPGHTIWVLRLSDRKPQPFLRDPSDETAPRFSPDGRWLAYVSDESGREEVYVQPYPGPGGKWQISTEGGNEPLWNRNGRELFYRDRNKMMAVEIATQTTFSAGKPRTLFEGQYMPGAGPSFANYDASPDGQHFLMIKDRGAQINVVLNWFEELKQKVPPGN
jgi:Tol biopolymer transport system component